MAFLSILLSFFIMGQHGPRFLGWERSLHVTIVAREPATLRRTPVLMECQGQTKVVVPCHEKACMSQRVSHRMGTWRRWNETRACDVSHHRFFKYGTISSKILFYHANPPERSSCSPSSHDAEMMSPRNCFFLP